jgi:hypothetical protein
VADLFELVGSTGQEGGEGEAISEWGRYGTGAEWGDARGRGVGRRRRCEVCGLNSKSRVLEMELWRVGVVELRNIWTFGMGYGYRLIEL